MATALSPGVGMTLTETVDRQVGAVPSVVQILLDLVPTNVFAAFADKRRDIFRLDFATGALTRLTDDRANDGGPVYSRDGAWIYFPHCDHFTS